MPGAPCAFEHAPRGFKARCSQPWSFILEASTRDEESTAARNRACSVPNLLFNEHSFDNHDHYNYAIRWTIILMPDPQFHDALRVSDDERLEGSVCDASEPLHLEVGFDSLAQKRKVFEWLGAGLRPDRPGRLQLEFPLLFKDNASVFHLTLFRDSTPIAFCCLWAVHFRIGVMPMRVGLISLVYTDANARGHGYAKLVVDAALERARALNLGLAMLWSEADSLYKRLGFTPAGSETLLVVDRPTLDAALSELIAECGPPPASVDSPTAKDWTAIERLRGDRDCQLELDPGELALMRSIPDMGVRVARDSNGVTAFAIRGRGDDFQEVIHEWAGDPAGVLGCCRDLLDDFEPHNELFLISPPDRSEVPWRLRRAGAPVIRKPLGWMRIVSASAFREDVSRIMAGPHDALESHRTTGDEEFRIASLDQTFAALPFSFFVWGMESI